MTLRAALASVVLFVLSFGACSSGGAHSSLRIELAPAIDCMLQTAEIPGDLRFFTVQICPSTGGGMCIPLTDPGGDHNGGTPLLRVARPPLDRRFTVDARIDGSIDYDVSVVGYTGGDTGTCMPYALGHALGVRFGRDDLIVRLYPVGGWSCAGTHAGQTTPVTRALHQAVLLPNRDVLILGGIAGPSAGSTAFSRPASAQRLVEVFDPRDARFRPVTISDEDGMAGFSRVMFQARYVRTNASGQYEIHTYGGFDIDHAPEGGLGFDGNANITQFSALFGPMSAMMMGSGAGFRSDAVILYDPIARTATVTGASGAQYTTSAATEGGTSTGVVRGIDSVSMMGGRPSAYGIRPAWYTDGGTVGTLQFERLGASITALSPTRFLVWGGHVANSTSMVLPAFMASMPLMNLDVFNDAGEVVTSGMMGSTLVAGHNPTMMADDLRPFATAYHTATHIAGPPSSTAILFAGGLQLQGGPGPLGVAAAVAPSPSLSVARFDATGAFMGGARVPGRPVGTVLHTATAVDATNTSVLVVGGASQMAASPWTTLFGERNTGYVAFDTATSTYAWHLLPDLASGRWGHTTTVIPNHGVLVVGGISRMDATLTVSDSAEFLLWEDLRGMGRPAPMNCASPDDAGMSGDAGMRDMGPRLDMGASVDAGARDMGPG